MILNKLKPYITAGTIGLAGILGMNTAKAEPVRKVIPAPMTYERPEEKPAQSMGLGLLLTGGEIAASLLTNQALHNRYDDLTLADQENLTGYRKNLPKLKTDYEYNDLSTVTKGIEWIIIAGELAAAFFGTVAIHEYGHAVTANIYGVDVRDIQTLPSTQEDGTFLFGYTIYDWKSYGKKSNFEKAQIAAGGMLATRTFAEKLDKLMDSTDMLPRLEQALAALYFMTRFDATRYILSCSIKSWTDNPIPHSNDPQDIINALMPKKKETHGTAFLPTKEEKIIYAIATGAVALDTLMDLKEIETNLRRLFAMETKDERENYNFNLSMIPGGVYANFTYQF